MHPDLRAEYERIGQERDEAARIAARERRWFFVRVAAACWVWVIVGAAVMAQAFRIDATVGAFYYPGLMAKAEAYLQGGVFIGTAGPLVTLIIGWRKASGRGYLD
ncbi:MAG TPA: hypothetical protein VFO55_01990 [Gemmatimonadaceae bacterium]|nr:hypothetical protein [Gemmatimonadaceae bacterium]